MKQDALVLMGAVAGGLARCESATGMNAYNSVDFAEPRTRRLAAVPNPAATLLIADMAFTNNHPPIESVADWQGAR